MRVFSKNGVRIPHGKGRLDRSFSLSAATKNSLSAQALHTPNSPKKNAEFALNSTLSPSKTDRKNHRKQEKISFRVHPLFFLVGIWYACTGELFLFLLSGLVAVQHELAHAFAAAKLGYKLNSIVLMPFGAVIDGDLEGLTAKDEILVAFWGPFCNLLTAVFFVALWWFAPTMYAFTDVVFYSSLAIALVNLLPAYPLDGGRILRCFLTRFFAKSTADLTLARRRAEKICRIVTILFSLAFFALFAMQCVQKTPNPTLLFFGIFLFVGGLGNRDKSAVYSRMDFSQAVPFQKGIEIRRVAVLASCPIKDAFRFLCKGCYLILELYDEQENHLVDISQNRLSALFAKAPGPYTPLAELVAHEKHPKKP